MESSTTRMTHLEMGRGACTATGGTTMPLEPGPNEQAVRATLPGRPANIINEASLGAQGCFAGFFNGASSKGIIFVPENDSLTIGKAECEWDWRENWGELKKLGL